MKYFALLSVLLVSLFAGGRGIAGADEVAVPPLSRRVTDLTNTLSQNQQQMLEETLRAFEETKGAQIAVLIVPTTGDETIEQYGLRVGETWKLGRKGVDDAAILVIAKNDKKMRIEVAYGLEGVLNDAVAKRITADIIRPKFRSGDFFGGIRDGVQTMLAVVEGEQLPAPSRREPKAGSGGLIPLLFIGWLFAAQILRTPLGSFGAAGALGFTGWFLALMFGAGLILSILIGILAFIATLFVGLMPMVPVSGGGWSSGRGGWSGGGGWSSGGGGFSGGGGGFGGGGASSDW